MFQGTNSLENTFYRRECIKGIPSLKDDKVCCCGLHLSLHPLHPIPGISPASTSKADPNATENWNPTRHTVPLPTNAFGCIDFQGGPHPSKAQYIRLAHDTKPDLVLTLLLQEWGLELPKLLITVNGGKQNFDLQPRLKKALGEGLLKAAKTTGAWILTGGLNTGVTKHVGDALVTERSPRLRSGRVVSIGVAPWGVVEARNNLIHKNKDIAYHSIHNPASRFAALNNRHAYFLLVDNGTVGKYGAELALRRKLEKFISLQKLNASKSRKFPYWTHCSTPLVCLVIEGGTNTIRSVLEYVTSSPPVPVVIFDGTGRAADILAFAYRYINDDGEPSLLLNEMYEEFLEMIQKTFKVDLEQADQLYREIIECVKKRTLITVYRCYEDQKSSEDHRVELDQTILTALFKSQHLSPAEQLSLALTWNREDIARSQVFQYGVEWTPGELEQAMMDALINDRVAFVKLLLENGVNMSNFLTIERLEELYNCKQGPANTLRYLVRDVVPKMPRGYSISLIDIGNVINQLMSGGYKSSYTRRRFRRTYVEVMSPVKVKLKQHLSKSMHPSTYSRDYISASFKKDNGTSQLIENPGSIKSGLGESTQYFDRPFSELMIWAVLTKRQDMAVLMWQHGEENIAKALVACTLYNAMAYEAEDDDLDVEIYEELLQYSKEFETHSCRVLDYCYQQDDDLTKQLLTASLENWSRQTCLSLAVLANNRKFLAHPLSQIILGDLWMGGLRMRKNPGFKIVLGLLFPPTLYSLEFKTKEELELMPQTEEEYILEKEDDDTTSQSSCDNSFVEVREDIESLGRVGPFFRPRVDSRGLSSLVEAREPGDLGETSIPNIDEVKRKTRPLKLKKKITEFYGAPITKFYCHSVAYLLFLCLYTYICLIKTPPEPSGAEIFVTLYVVTYGMEKIRQIFALEPTELSQKWKVWVSNSMWHPCDLAGIIIYLLGFLLRWDPGTRAYARVIYCTVINYFFVRLFKFLSVSKYFGPVVTMMYRMIKNMLYFIVLLLVVLVSFGVCNQSIKYPNEEWHWRLLRHVFYQPYFMLYGEVYAPDIDPECNPDCTAYGECGEAIDGSMMVPCHPGRWVTPVVMTLYLLCANILIINLLIAVFNNIYIQVNAISHEVWNFQRFSVVMEYEEKPVLPPPLIIFSHFYRFFRTVYRRFTGAHGNLESGLKLFLDRYALEKLYDFEEECVENYMYQVEESKKENSEIRLLNVMKRTEKMGHKMDLLNTNLLNLLQTNDLGLRKLEDLCEKTASQLAVIHRFMSNHTGDFSESQQNLVENLPVQRVRRKSFSRSISERSSHGVQELAMELEEKSRKYRTDRFKRLKSPSPFDASPENSPRRQISNDNKTGKFKKVRTNSSGSDKYHKMSIEKSKRRRERTLSSERDLGSDISEESSEDDYKPDGRMSAREDAISRENMQEDAPPRRDITVKIQECRSEAGGSQVQGSKSDSSVSSREGYRDLLKVYNRKHLAATRDYTSITDELEGRLPNPVQEDRLDKRLPAIRVEENTLMDAEEADYNLFENLIERRLLRKESTNFHSSMEEMINKSIREDSSSSDSSSDPDNKGDMPALTRVQSSKIRTRRYTKPRTKESLLHPQFLMPSPGVIEPRSPILKIESDKGSNFSPVPPLLEVPGTPGTVHLGPGVLHNIPGVETREKLAKTNLVPILPARDTGGAVSSSLLKNSFFSSHDVRLSTEATAAQDGDNFYVSFAGGKGRKFLEKKRNNSY